MLNNINGLNTRNIIDIITLCLQPIRSTVISVTTASIIIPIDEKDPDNYVPVCINGVITQIKKGEEVEVPEEIYNILKRSGYLGIKVN